MGVSEPPAGSTVMATAPARATTSAQLGGNLPDDAEVGDELVREVTVYDATGNPRQLSLTFTRTAGGWGVAGTDGAGATGRDVGGQPGVQLVDAGELPAA